jgi:hypothetical protein
MYTRGKLKAIQRADEETTDNQDGSVGTFSFYLMFSGFKGKPFFF